jgi:hypothetical protein
VKWAEAGIEAQLVASQPDILGIKPCPSHNFKRTHLNNTNMRFATMFFSGLAACGFYASALPVELKRGQYII